MDTASHERLTSVARLTAVARLTSERLTGVCTMTSRRGMWSSGSAAKMKNEILFFCLKTEKIFLKIIKGEVARFKKPPIVMFVGYFGTGDLPIVGPRLQHGNTSCFWGKEKSVFARPPRERRRSRRTRSKRRGTIRGCSRVPPAGEHRTNAAPAVRRRVDGAVSPAWSAIGRLTQMAANRAQAPAHWTWMDGTLAVRYETADGIAVNPTGTNALWTSVSIAASRHIKPRASSAPEASRSWKPSFSPSSRTR